MPPAVPPPDVPSDGTALAALRALPSELRGVLEPELPGLADAIVAAIADEVDAYRRPFEGAFGDAVREGVRVALGRFVALAGAEAPSEQREAEAVYVALGRGEVRAGRSLDALQAAYRLGARVAWRRFAEAARRAGGPAGTDECLIALGEAIFAYIDRLSALSVAGWATEERRRAGAAQRAREQLVRAACRSDVDPVDLAHACEAAGWRPPERASVLVAGDDDAAAVARGTGGAPQTSVGGVQAWLLADPDAPGALAARSRALSGVAAVEGPAVPWGETVTSFLRARDVHRLRVAGRLPAAGVLEADAHLVDLLVHGVGGPEAADALLHRALGPLEELPTARAARARETLGAWLEHRGQAPPMAEALHLHPQTVRYRVARLREVLGPVMDDADGRLALELALRRRGG